MILKFKLVFSCLIALSLLFSFSSSFAQNKSKNNQICAVYLTGIGCPACKQIEPFLIDKLIPNLPQLVIIEYEIYQNRQANLETAQHYFDSFLDSKTHPGIPALVFNNNAYIGAELIRGAAESIKEKNQANCPLPGGNSLPLEEINLSQLSGQPRIWTKNRVFILENKSPGTRARNTCLRRLIQTNDLTAVLKTIDFKEINPRPVNTSRGEIKFEKAVKVGSWRIQWNGASIPEPAKPSNFEFPPPNWFSLLLAFILGLLAASFFLCRKKINLLFKNEKKRFLIACALTAALIFLFFLALNFDSSLLRSLGYQLPLPLFTFIIALLDGFNPCNMFVLTVLLTLLISASASRRRFYLVGFIFVLVVFIFYFFFMLAWLNVFRYIGFAGPLRIFIAVVAILVGLINCKEFFFFKKGPNLMISEKHKGPLYARMRKLTEIVNKGSLALLISSSLALAIFSSLIEIPCTAGFPLLYTSILSAQTTAGEFSYIFYLLFYNLVYLFPLLTIIVILGFTFQARRVSEKQVQVIKLIGGVIMIFLGIILLVNPQLIGAGI